MIPNMLVYTANTANECQLRLVMGEGSSGCPLESNQTSLQRATDVFGNLLD